MAIRRDTNPRPLDLQPELQDVLQRNGMQAHIVGSSNGFQLVVQGHDSPVLAYNISQQQLKFLTDWGTNYANRKAYNTFASLVKDDFDMPRDFVHARNANGRVAMGLHGYRIGVGEYGRMARPLPVQMAAMTMPMGRWPHFGWHCAPPRHLDPGGYFRPFLGWSLRQQEGFHLRRIGGNLYYPGAPMVYDRPTGRKPGELQSGGYGFYWKGQQPQFQQLPRQDVLTQLQTVIQPIPAVQRPTEAAKPYKELITSDVYFSSEKWQEALKSHGIVIDAENKVMTIQSASLPADMQYDLKPEELAVLTSNSIQEHPVAERIALVNDIIKVDFDSKVTMDMLNDKSLIDIAPKPELLQEVSQYNAVEQTQPQGLESDIRIAYARTDAPAIPLNKAIDDPEYFDQLKWCEVLASHGLVIDHANKTLTVQSGSVNADLTYKLSDNDYAVITNKSLNEHDYELRVEVINDNIGKDFADSLTVDMLNSDKRVNLNLRPEVAQSLFEQMQNEMSVQSENANVQYAGLPEDNRQGVVNMHGSDLDYINPEKGWFREGQHGREVTVDDIRVEPTEVEGKYKMTAIIDGEVISHEIKQKDYDKFLAVDDYHRMKLFSKIFNEVDMKDRYPVGLGTKLTAGLLAGLVVTGEVMHGLRGCPPPEIYMGCHPGPCPRPYFKPGVDTPMDVAARNFEAHANTEQMRHDLGMGPGR